MRFLDAIQEELNKGNRVVIPDIKCYSPKDGDLFDGRDPVEVAVGLVKAGAKVCSVVTEEKEFKGSMKLLEDICKATQVPVLRKDFIHTKEDLIETKNAGASAILLMCSCLTKEEMEYLYQEALNVGLDPFVETHSKEEMEFATSLGAKIIGINNRNILQLEKDDGNVGTTCEIIQYAPKDAVLVSESSIMNSYDVGRAFVAGADVALVGTAIWKAKDPYAFYKSLIRKTRLKICGLMREEDVDTCMKYGVDILGFVCEYPKSVPWELGRKRAKELVSRVSPMHQSCIVVGGEPDKIIEVARYVKPSMIQVHYYEDLKDIAYIKAKLQKDNIQVIRSIADKEDIRVRLFGTTDTVEIVERLCETCVDGILLDARDASNAEQSGYSADVESFLAAKRTLEQKNTNIELTIAGGITPDNIGEYLMVADPACVDIMTGVELETGVKDEEKIKRVTETLNNYSNT